MAISPPSDKIWWNNPVHRVELIWIAVAFAWGLVMFFMMIYWHATGSQNLATESYRTTPNAYYAKVERNVADWQVRELNGIPVIKPPIGADIYLLGRMWLWYPVIELERGQSYRLHLSSLDLQHGFSLQPININVQVHPGYEHVLTVTPDKSGEYTVVCNEFCGLGHHMMLGKIFVVDR
ncbi:MAG: cytochrome C oxidase subunit II [Gammaproteobacteria bacterium]|nr:cytochrome C oxidase subunit II [Gammaproteobacteria bacterium]